MTKTPKLKVNQHGYIERVAAPDASYNPPLTPYERLAVVNAANAYDRDQDLLKQALAYLSTLSEPPEGLVGMLREAVGE